MLRIVKLVAGLALVASVPAKAASFDYKFTEYPKDAGDCHQLAAAFGPAFAQAAGVAVTKSECTNITDFGYDFDITYTADQALTPVSTLDFQGGADERGAFATDADCRTQLALEAQHFQTATGLSPFVAYCYADPYAMDFSYAIHIDAFGTPAESPFVAAPIVFGTPSDTTTANVEHAVLAGLTARGIDVSYVRYKDDSDVSRIFIFYYGRARAQVAAPDLGSLRSADQCAAESAQLNTALTGYAGGPLVTYCANDSLFGFYYLETLQLKDATAFAVEPAAESYSSYSDCATARAAEIQMYKTQLGRPVLGAVCGADTGTGGEAWRLMLIETPS